MAYLKADEVRKMNGDERAKSLKDLRQELVHERGIAAMGGSPPSPGKIRQIRRQIARILTIQNEERIGLRGQTVKAPTPQKPVVTPKKAPSRNANPARKVVPKLPKEDAAKLAARKHAGKAATKSEAKKPAAHKAAPHKAAAPAAHKKTKKEE